MAAVLAAEGLDASSAARRLVLISFENDLDSLKLALDHPRWFKHLRHAAPRSVLSEDRWTNGSAAIDWQLLRGDFSVRKFDAPSPDIIFFDPFSFKTDSALWTLPAFRELALACAHKPAELFTYTYSTSVRAAMLAAGFYVAKGRATGPKAETTIGLSPRAAAAPHAHDLLGQEWLAKWRRSDAQAPFGSSLEDATWHEAVLNHPQFR
jgi:queuine tRNA-ribosyltransferase